MNILDLEKMFISHKAGQSEIAKFMDRLAKSIILSNKNDNEVVELKKKYLDMHRKMALNLFKEHGIAGAKHMIEIEKLEIEISEAKIKVLEEKLKEKENEDKKC